ncbi:endocuticle structural glycoprotein SgAbd-8 [Pieris rapae]|uniref:endocuticle structural glycoprotein SgAbd-8 n=1 Tax=Pieris rapae TaxID=64459 RepID=UPI000B92C0F1|nr:endocuticle structural glycoprotein SgAbd-8 [Pieris rapae]
MKLLIVLSAVLALSAAVPQRRLSLKPEGQNDQQTAEQNYNNYQQGDYRPQQAQEFRKPVEDFRPRVELDTTTYIPIIHFDKEQANDGSYKTSYETGNNIHAQEQGFLRNVRTDDEDIPALVQQGSYSYTAPDGQIITVEYTADEFGFRVKGDHIPTPPPVSPEIQKGLDLIYAGIKANEERFALEAKNNPAAAKLNEEQASLNYRGQYNGQQ